MWHPAGRFSIGLYECSRFARGRLEIVWRLAIYLRRACERTPLRLSLTGTSNDSFLLKMKCHICVRLGDRGYSRQRFSSLQTQRPPRCREKNSASPCPLRLMTSDREPLLLEPQRAPMKALPSNARFKLMSNPQNAFQSKLSRRLAA